mmetsp:Transcript_54796/g.168893  ORF Transcript_54796/g.168893 Transcript_54796/m.168893 type:complete len:302 (-) Transcript_54796:764-1669(-)
MRRGEAGVAVIEVHLLLGAVQELDGLGGRGVVGEGGNGLPVAPALPVLEVADGAEQLVQHPLAQRVLGRHVLQDDGRATAAVLAPGRAAARRLVRRGGGGGGRQGLRVLRGDVVRVMVPNRGRCGRAAEHRTGARGGTDCGVRIRARRHAVAAVHGGAASRLLRRVAAALAALAVRTMVASRRVERRHRAVQRRRRHRAIVDAVRRGGRHELRAAGRAAAFRRALRLAVALRGRRDGEYRPSRDLRNAAAVEPADSFTSASGGSEGDSGALAVGGDLGAGHGAVRLEHGSEVRHGAAGIDG